MSGVRAQIPSVGLSQINLETFYGLRAFRWILSDVFVSFCLP